MGKAGPIGGTIPDDTPERFHPGKQDLYSKITVDHLGTCTSWSFHNGATYAE